MSVKKDERSLLILADNSAKAGFAYLYVCGWFYRPYLVALGVNLLAYDHDR